MRKWSNSGAESVRLRAATFPRGGLRRNRKTGGTDPGTSRYTQFPVLRQKLNTVANVICRCGSTTSGSEPTGRNNQRVDQIISTLGATVKPTR